MTIVSQDGRRHEDVRLLYLPLGVVELLGGAELGLRDGDRVEREAAPGRLELYRLRDPRFYPGWFGIPPHYEARLELLAAAPGETAPGETAPAAAVVPPVTAPAGRDYPASCFISYSTADQAFTDRLYQRLTREGVAVWYAPADVQGGVKLYDQLKHGIQTHRRLLLVLSEASLRSEWVTTEIRHARRREREEGSRKLFPIRLVPFETLRDWECFDADSGKDLGVEIREYFIPDFSNWKDAAAFEAAFARLLRDLRAAAGQRP